MSPSAARTARTQARDRVREQMVARAREQLATEGPGSLSLRAIARDLGMPSSGIYRYFTGRDELLTALLIEVYRELGSVVRTAGEQPGDAPERFASMARAMRAWALANPFDWALLYGSPVPGYAAPPDTVGPALTVTQPFIDLFSQMASTDHYQPPAKAVAAVAPIMALAGVGDDDSAVVVAGVIAWEGIMGAISMELFGHLHGAVDDYDAHFEQVITRQVRGLSARADRAG